MIAFPTFKQTQCILLLISQLCFAQETHRISTHEQHMLEFGSIEKKGAQIQNQAFDIIPIQPKSYNTLSHIVFGFLPDWEYSSEASANLQYDLLSHIAVFNFETSDTGNLTPPVGWPWTDVINTAHQKSTKVIMVVTNFKAAQIHTLLTNSSSKNTLFTSIKNTISSYQLDGVNIDFEGIDPADRGDLLNSFMSELTNYIHLNLPGKEVSFDSPAVNWGGWKFNDLAASVDHLFIMAYDYHGSWSTFTGAVSPLVHPSGGISVTKSLSDDYAVAIANYPQKIILGVPYYGKKWKTSTGNAGATVTEYVGSTFYRTTAVEAFTHGGYTWDNNSETPYYAWQNPPWHQVWADNPESLGLKYDLALDKAIGGIGIWALNYDGNRDELWDLIERKFNTALSLNDAIFKLPLKVFPNPTHNLVRIENHGSILIKGIQLSNCFGQNLLIVDRTVTSIDLGNYASGLYFLKIMGENGEQAVFKLIKK